MNSEKAVKGEGQEKMVRMNRHRTFIQKTAIHVQCDTRSQW